MNTSDLPTLRDRLSELAEAVGAKGPGEAGVKAWLMALRDFPMPDVADAIDQWLRTKPKMAAPADIRLILAGRLSDRIERKAVAEAAEFAQGAKRIASEANRKLARMSLDRIALALSAARRNDDPADWWHKLIARWRSGEELLWIQTVMCKTAWENSGGPEEWAPPGIDPEWDAEREAIQSEGA